jgi:hypothetical protein
MAETGRLGHAGSVGSSGDALAHVGSVSSGDTYALGSRGGARALCHTGMDHRVDLLGLECTGTGGRARVASVPHGSARGSVGVIGSVN